MLKKAFQITLCGCSLLCEAALASVIQLPNQSPLIAIYGLPSPVDFNEAKKRISVNINVGNNFVPRTSENESLLLDGETTRLLTHYRQRISDCWMFGVQLPLINHSGGVLDSFVDDWHQWFDLPESGRPNLANEQLLYRYTVDGEVVVHHDEAGAGVGDTSLIFTQRMQCSIGRGRLMRAGIKLPTGDPDRLFGSGASDVFLDMSQRFTNIYKSLDLSYTAGLLVMGKSHVLPAQHRAVVYGTVSVELPVTSRISLDAQIAVQSAHIESELRVLSDWPVQLIIGGSLQLSKSTVWNFALSEDPEYGTSSDVVFQLGVRRHF